MKIPVLVLAFNRADKVVDVLRSIREYKPSRLYLACDGARANKIEEKVLVEATQKAMLDAVNWDCDVKTLFRNENLGCANAVYEAISWFFKNEKYGIICEDDVIIGLDFFRLCEDLLPRYEKDERIMHINSQNYAYGKSISNKILFGKAMFCWGWASWARAWKKMDMSMTNWPNYNKRKMLSHYGLIKTLFQIHYWTNDYKAIKLGTCCSWATRWNFSVLYNEGLCINPQVNLSLNIGTDSGVHYKGNDEKIYKKLLIGKVSWPISIPDVAEESRHQNFIDNKEFIRVRLWGLKKKIKRLYYGR